MPDEFKNQEYLFLTFLLLVKLVFGQNENPFEIKSRLKFENNTLNHNGISNKSDSSIIDSIGSLEMEGISGVTDDTINYQNTDESEDYNTYQNPFEVDSIEINSSVDLGSNIDKKTTFKFGKVNFENFKEKHQDKGSTFVFWILLLTLLILSVIVTLNRELIIRIIKSVWFNNIINGLLRNFGSKEMTIYLLLFLNFLLNFSLFIYLIINYKYGLGGFSFYLWILLFVFLIYIIKHTLIILFTAVFTSLKNIKIYNFTIFIFNIVLGIYIIILNAFTAFTSDAISNYFMYFGIVLVAILYIFRLLRGFLSTYNYFINSIFHFFIYLCAFEFLPLLIIYKFFIDF